jgi:hypothetical protein
MLKRPTTKEFKLNVPQFIQNDNTGGKGYRECFLTSCAMLTEYLLDGELTRRAKAAGYAEPEDAYAVVLDDHGDTTDWGAQIKALADFGITAYASHSASVTDVVTALRCGVPVVLGNAYKGGGHITLAFGVAATGLHVYCPYGIRRGSTNSWEKIFYSDSEARPDFFSLGLLSRIFADMGPEAGWCLFVTHVKGVPTGVPTGL